MFHEQGAYRKKAEMFYWLLLSRLLFDFIALQNDCIGEVYSPSLLRTGQKNINQRCFKNS